MSGIGKLHDDGHVPCNNKLYYLAPWLMNVAGHSSMAIQFYCL